MKKNLELTNADNGFQNEKSLIRRVQEGYRSEFTGLIALYQKRVFTFAYGFFQDKDDAMEIVQETFLRMYERIGGFSDNESQSGFKNWVYRIAYNICIDFYRKFKKQKVDMKEIYQYNEDSRTATTRPEDQLDLENFRHLLKKSVMRLPKRQKEVFILRHYSGLKHQEISGVLNLSIGTVKSLYHRSVRNLKKNLVDKNNHIPLDLNINIETGNSITG